MNESPFIHPISKINLEQNGTLSFVEKFRKSIHAEIPEADLLFDDSQQSKANPHKLREIRVSLAGFSRLHALQVFHKTLLMLDPDLNYKVIFSTKRDEFRTTPTRLTLNMIREECKSFQYKVEEINIGQNPNFELYVGPNLTKEANLDVS